MKSTANSIKKRVGLVIPENYSQYQRKKKRWKIKDLANGKTSKKIKEESQVHEQTLDHYHNYDQMIPSLYDYDDTVCEEEAYEDELNSRYLKRQQEKNDRGKTIKTLFALLMIPSVIVMFNSHKRMNKQESNYDVSGIAGLGGRMGGLPGMGGVGHAGLPGGIGDGFGPNLGSPAHENGHIASTFPHHGRHSVPTASNRQSRDDTSNRGPLPEMPPDIQDKFLSGFQQSSEFSMRKI
jgi:hypothetical protein